MDQAPQRGDIVLDRPFDCLGATVCIPFRDLCFYRPDPSVQIVLLDLGLDATDLPVQVVLFDLGLDVSDLPVQVVLLDLGLDVSDLPVQVVLFDLGLDVSDLPVQVVLLDLGLDVSDLPLEIISPDLPSDVAHLLVQIVFADGLTRGSHLALGPHYFDLHVGQLPDDFVLGFFPKPRRGFHDLPYVVVQCAKPDFAEFFSQCLGHRVQFSQVELFQSPCRCLQRLFHSSGYHPGHPPSQACDPPFMAPDFAAKTRDVSLVGRYPALQTRDVSFVRRDLATQTGDVSLVGRYPALQTRDVSFVRRDLATQTGDVSLVGRYPALQTRDVPFVRRDLATQTGDVPFVGRYLPAHAAFLTAQLQALLGAHQHGQHQVAPVAGYVVEGLGAATDAPLVFQAAWAGGDRHPVKALGL